ncbi:MotA/TolQ/ExbB proton channel family protein [Marinisporobacter balticus]|uniref:Biopolymer transport protein ExbB/TolQ n=1 Tax=Marinisporobacter balticus TaxID=2018667 RepID=A0A4R2KZP7_9FIRM|nr:MotA/TolQ/ExbB proton channel family protein [Marinisporobacter balticus]TCO76929.1 biopolymer transport protein ExbB/TolQ [Marinisporobacter balticus]
MNIPCSEALTTILHAIAQSFLIPVIVGLLLMVIFIFLELGHFIGERQKRKENKKTELVEVFCQVQDDVWKKNNLCQVVEKSGLSKRQKEIIFDYIEKANIDKYSRKALAIDILDQEEVRIKNILNKTDLITKIGPVLGLMGTLIPLGPGLGQLGQGDVAGLSESMIIAFDTTVVGVAVGAFASVISKIRRGWYQKDLNRMEVLLELIDGGEEVVEEQEKKNVRRTGN